MVKELISSKIKNIRTLHKLSQEEFAEKLEVSRQTVYYWEAGKAVPDYNKIVLLCKEFSLSPNEFFYDDVCACTVEDCCDVPESDVAEEQQTERKRPSVKKFLWASVMMLVGIALLATGIKGIIWGFETPSKDSLARVSTAGFNFSGPNVLAILFSIIALALVVLSLLMFVRCKNKKNKIRSK